MVEEAPILRLEMLGSKPVLARESGLMIERLANAFDQAIRSGNIGAGEGRLRVERLTLGSIIVDLSFLTAVAMMAWDQRQALGAFVSFLADSLALIREFRANEVPSAHRSMFESFAAPVAKGNATQVNLFLVGDNEGRIEIGPQLAEAIMSAVARPRGSGSGPYDARPYVKEAVRASVVRPVQEMVQAERAVGRSIDYARPAFNDTPIMASGTMLTVGSEWYVRAEGFSGALLPVAPNSRELENLDKAAQYTVDGIVNFSGDRPLTYQVDKVLHRAD